MTNKDGPEASQKKRTAEEAEDIQMEVSQEMVSPYKQGKTPGNNTSAQQQYISLCSQQLARVEETEDTLGRIRAILAKEQQQLRLHQLQLERTMVQASLNHSHSQHALAIAELSSAIAKLERSIKDLKLLEGPMAQEASLRFTFYQSLKEKYPYALPNGQQVINSTMLDAVARHANGILPPIPETEELKKLYAGNQSNWSRMENLIRQGDKPEPNPGYKIPKRTKIASGDPGSSKQPTRDKLLEAARIRNQFCNMLETNMEEEPAPPKPPTKAEKRAMEDYTLVIPLKRESVKGKDDDYYAAHLNMVVDLTEVDPESSSENISYRLFRDWKETLSEADKEAWRKARIAEHKHTASGRRAKGKIPQSALTAPSHSKGKGPHFLIFGKRGSVILQQLILMGPYFVGNNAHRIRSLRQEANPITTRAPEPGTYRVLYATKIPYYVNDKHVALAINAWESAEQKTAGIIYWKCSPVNGDDDDEEGTQHIRLEFYSPEMRQEVKTSYSFTIKAAGETLLPELVPEEHYDNTPYKTEERKPKDSRRVPVKAKRPY